jgi:hypothetical protein
MSKKRKDLSVYSWTIHGEGSWFAFKEGYIKAIRLLVKEVMRERNRYIDELIGTYGLVYPIVFLSRHYLEVELKQVIALAGLMGFTNEKKRYGHKLGLLWTEVLSCIEASLGLEARKDLQKNIGPFVAFFERLDPDGDSFRYPKTISGEAHWKDSFQVDVAELNDWVDLCSRYFYDLLQELKAMLDQEADDIGDRSYFYLDLA